MHTSIIRIMGYEKELLDQLIRRYGETPLALGEEKKRGSAILVPFVVRNGELQIVFEVRSFDLPAQPGEVCLPGGRIERGESPEDAAVRETAEELLIDSGKIRVLFPLDGMIGPGGRPVWSFVGLLDGYEDTFSDEEVDHVFTVPLSWFLEDEPERYETELATIPGEDFPFERIPGGRDYPWRMRYYDVLFYHWPHENIWGLTAKVIRQLTERIEELSG